MKPDHSVSVWFWGKKPSATVSTTSGTPRPQEIHVRAGVRRTARTARNSTKTPMRLMTDRPTPPAGPEASSSTG